MECHIIQTFTRTYTHTQHTQGERKKKKIKIRCVSLISYSQPLIVPGNNYNEETHFTYVWIPLDLNDINPRINEWKKFIKILFVPRGKEREWERKSESEWRSEPPHKFEERRTGWTSVVVAVVVVVCMYTKLACDFVVQNMRCVFIYCQVVFIKRQTEWFIQWKTQRYSSKVLSMRGERRRKKN